MQATLNISFRHPVDGYPMLAALLACGWEIADHQLQVEVFRYETEDEQFIIDAAPADRLQDGMRVVDGWREHGSRAKFPLFYEAGQIDTYFTSNSMTSVEFWFFGGQPRLLDGHGLTDYSRLIKMIVVPIIDAGMVPVIVSCVDSLD